VVWGGQPLSCSQEILIEIKGLGATGSAIMVIPGGAHPVPTSLQGVPETAPCAPHRLSLVGRAPSLITSGAAFALPFAERVSAKPTLPHSPSLAVIEAHTHSEEQRPGFSVARVPVVCGAPAYGYERTP
jgi:hypothetical protein